MVTGRARQDSESWDVGCERVKDKSKFLLGVTRRKEFPSA